MKIAIIGSGISGNTIAHLLYKDHDIQVFENDSRIGGHSHTHNISVEENKEITVDTGRYLLLFLYFLQLKYCVCENDRQFDYHFQRLGYHDLYIVSEQLYYQICQTL